MYYIVVLLWIKLCVMCLLLLRCKHRFCSQHCILGPCLFISMRCWPELCKAMLEAGVSTANHTKVSLSYCAGLLEDKIECHG
ncbi:hypothetical protein COO60DRAFT_1518111 [Scenedesmus sp. NREL 46B-D3]|nr:hypothetical protein COO60DRAFT_1518111 [Scenedesmus sp. NREL 46B-D3]